MKSFRARFAIILLSLLVSLSGGCASIIHGTGQDIPIASTPSGASVKVDGVPAGRTPTTAHVKRGNDHVVSIGKNGYETEDLSLTRHIGGAVFGNILVGGLIGWGVDAITGAQYNLRPNTINVWLRPMADTPERRSPAQTSTMRSPAARTPSLPADEPTAFPTAARTPSVAGFGVEMGQLAALRKNGIIDDEEFAARRKILVDKYTKL